MENKNSTNTPRTAEVRLPGDKLQNEKKMPSFHHPTSNPPKKQDVIFIKKCKRYFILPPYTFCFSKDPIKTVYKI